MIDAGTNMGLVEVPQGANGTVDLSEVGDLNPNAKAIIAVNPHSAHIAVTRVEGITNTLTAPTGGLISGQAALINLLGTAPKEMAVVPQARARDQLPAHRLSAVVVLAAFSNKPANLAETLTANERQVEQIRKMLRDAEAYGRAQDAYAKDKSLPRPDRNVVLEPLVPYVRGEQPVIFRADREAEIRGALRFAEEMKLKPIILGGNDAWKVANLLEREERSRDSDRHLFASQLVKTTLTTRFMKIAAKLQQAGVRFCISTGDAGPEVRNLAQYAGMAAAFGLSKADAVKAVTLYPAQISECGGPFRLDRGRQDGQSGRD